MKLIILSILSLISLTKSDNAAQLGQFPHHAYVQSYDGIENRYCDGALIRYNWILMAAHCVDGAIDMYIRLGVINLMTPPQWQGPAEAGDVYVYPGYDINVPHVNDVGLVRIPNVDSSILSGNIGTIALPTGVRDLTYTQATVSGFGVATGEGEILLRYISMPIMSRAWCESIHGVQMDAGMLCTDTFDDNNPCMKDSGSPLIAQLDGTWSLVGVGSVWMEPCTAGHHGVFARVDNFLGWINGVIG